MQTIIPLTFLVPLCVNAERTDKSPLANLATNAIFDPNVLRIIAAFMAKFEPRLIRTWGSRGKAPGQFHMPGAVAVLARSQDQGLARSQDRGHPTMDLVFVADTYNHRIQTFRGDGTVLTQWGSRGSADGQFQCPVGMAVLAQSQDRILARSQDRGHPTRHLLFVTDDGNHRVQVFNVDGSFVRKWGSKGHGDGQFSRAFGVAVHPTQDLVYVTDRETQRIQVFGIDGLFITKWGTKGSDPGQFDGLHGVTVHPTRDLIFTSEDNLHRIQAFRSDGTFLFQRGGSHGRSEGEFSYPKHLAIHPIRDLLFVSDFGNSRVQVFRLDGSFVGCWRSEGRARCTAVHLEQNVVYTVDCNYDRVQAFSLFSNPPKRKRSSFTDDTRVVIRKK